MKRAIRPLFYFIFCLLFVVSILYKQDRIRLSRAKPQTTFHGEWKTFGKPVKIETAEIKPLFREKTCILKPLSDAEYQALISPGLHMELEENMSVRVGNEKGWISKLHPNRDLETGFYPIEITFESPLDTLDLTATIEMKSEDSNVTIPRALLTKEEGLSYVWILNGQNQAYKREVKPGPKNKTHIVIVDGLNPGDKIITEGTSTLKSGEKVRIVRST